MTNPQPYPFQNRFFIDTLPVKTGVYAICHSSGKVYIGSSGRLFERWKQHRQALRRGSHCNPELQAVFDRDGESALSFVILEPVERRHFFTLRTAENRWIEHFKKLEGVFNVYTA